MITDNDIKKLKGVFATKDDLKKFATKDDLKKSYSSLEFKLNGKIENTKQELLDKIDERYSDIFNLVDGLAKEIVDNREFRTIISYRVDCLEKR
jgi:hypothetical protein